MSYLQQLWARTETDARQNRELHQPGGAWRQLKGRIAATAVILMGLVVLLVVVGATMSG
jgi:hypothetical protein